MKLEKAIKILQQMRNIELGDTLAGGTDALKLGIEALKWFEQSFDHRSVIAHVLLPGETT